MPLINLVEIKQAPYFLEQQFVKNNYAKLILGKCY